MSRDGWIAQYDAWKCDDYDWRAYQDDMKRIAAEEQEALAELFSLEDSLEGLPETELIR